MDHFESLKEANLLLAVQNVEDVNDAFRVVQAWPNTLFIKKLNSACTVEVLGGALWPCKYGWEQLVRKADFYLTDVTIDELDTSSTGHSARMPLDASDVGASLDLCESFVQVDPAKVKELMPPRYSLLAGFGIVTRVIRSQGEPVMFEVTSVLVDRTGWMKGRVPPWNMCEHLVRRTIVWYASSAESELEKLYPDHDDDDDE